MDGKVWLLIQALREHGWI